MLSRAAISASWFCTISMASSRPGVAAIQGLQLQCQALPEVARCDAARLQRLHDAQRGLELSGLDVRQPAAELLERLTQEAILVERVHDQVREHVVALGQPEKQQLLAQGVVEGRRGGGPLGPVRRVIATAAAAGGSRRNPGRVGGVSEAPRSSLPPG